MGSFGNINEFAYELDNVSLSLDMRILFLIDLFKLLFEWKTKNEINENDINVVTGIIPSHGLIYRSPGQ